MEQPSITVETPKDSTILAYGTAPSFGYRTLFTWGLALLGVFLLVFLAWWSLSRPFLISARTLLVITRPTVAQTEIHPALRKQLPGPWQQALKSNSRWPVTLGGGLGPNGWNWFAIVPRWLSVDPSLPMEVKGAVRIIYDQPPVPATGGVTYAEGLGAWMRHPGSGAVGTFALEAVSPSSTTASFVYKNGVFHTSLLFDHPFGSFHPRAADISLDLSPLIGTNRAELLKELPIPRFALLPTLQEIHLTFREEGPPEQVELTHQDPLTRDQIKQVLAGFGITTKHVIQLADGTLATELSSGDGRMDAPVAIHRGDHLFIQDASIRYGSSTDPLPALPPACGNQPIMGRISARALQKLVQGIGLMFDISSVTGWQVGKDRDGYLLLCRE